MNYCLVRHTQGGSHFVNGSEQKLTGMERNTFESISRMILKDGQTELIQSVVIGYSKILGCETEVHLQALQICALEMAAFRT